MEEEGVGLAHLVVVMVVAVLEDLVRLEGGRGVGDSNRRDFRFDLHLYRGKGRDYDMPYFVAEYGEQSFVILHLGLLYTECESLLQTRLNHWRHLGSFITLITP